MMSGREKPQVRDTMPSAAPRSAPDRTLSPVDQAYNFMLEGILSGDLAPGMRVRTEAVAETLGISRMPVRDALRRLEADGAVMIFANRGASVAEYSRDEVVQLIERALRPDWGCPILVKSKSKSCCT
jgi:DNA-binding GntR family transcriptional regulator